MKCHGSILSSLFLLAVLGLFAFMSRDSAMLEYVLAQNTTSQSRDTLVIALAYFNYRDTALFLDSLCGVASGYEISTLPFDVILLENPSKYSEKMGLIAQSYISQGRLLGHLRSNLNVGFELFEQFSERNYDFLSRYQYIVVTEGDCMLERGLFAEAVRILNVNPQCVSVAARTSTENLLIPPLPPDAAGWVPKGIEMGDHYEGASSAMFLLMKMDLWVTFLKGLRNGTIRAGGVALGASIYQGFSDSNMNDWIFQVLRKSVCRTKVHEAIHLAWDHYMNPADEYVKQKSHFIETKQTRHKIHSQKEISFTLVSWSPAKSQPVLVAA